MPALLPTAAPKAVAIAPPATPSPFSIDPDRSQEMAPSGWLTAAPKAVAIAPPATPSPFSIDADRSQELPWNYGA